MQKIPVFVISLKTQVERRRLIKKNLDNLGVKFEFIDAIDGKKLSGEYVKSISAKKIPVGHVGCYLSHIKVYDIIEEKNIQVALILEDDAILDKKILPLLIKGCPPLFDLCFIDSARHNDYGTVFYDKNSGVFLNPGLKAYTLSSGPQRTHALLISKRAASRRLDNAFPIKEPIDCYEYIPYRLDFKSIVSPKMAWLSPLSNDSIISNTLIKHNPKFVFFRKKLWFFLLCDFLKIGFIRNLILKRKMIRLSILDKSKEWVPLPPSANILHDPHILE